MTEIRANRAVAQAVLLGLLLVVLLAGRAVGAESTPDPLALFEGGDPRSDGGGPGIVGSPVLILGAVVLLGIVTAVVTILIVRLTGRR
jgi:hypothetical protein